MKRISVYLFSLAFLSWLFVGVGCYFANKLINNYASKNELLMEQVKEKQNIEKSGDVYAGNRVAKENQEENYPVSASDNINATLSNVFYLCYVNDEIVVYEQDKNTIYMNTGIDASHLSSESLKELKEGIWVESEEELFSLLESYSS